MLERQYRLDPWMAVAAVVAPIVLSLPFLHANPGTPWASSLLLAVKTLGLMPAPGYPVYLLATRALAWLLPLGAWAVRLQLIQLLYLGMLSGLVYQLGRRLMFPPPVAFASAMTLVFSPWVWPEATLPVPLTLNVCMLLFFFLVTLKLLTAPPNRYLRLTLLGWGLLGGIAGGQEWALAAWVVPAVVAGFWLFPNKRVSPVVWLWALVGLLLGSLGPYAYLPWRLFSPAAFINTDLVPQFAAWRDSWTLELITRWLQLYFQDPSFLLPHLASSVKTLWPFFKSLPFLTLSLWLTGCILHLRQWLFTPLHAPATDAAWTGRMAAGGIPLFALPATLLLFSGQPGVLAFSAVLGGTLWGFAGFNYVYEELGRAGAAKSKLTTGPTAFGMAVLALVPLLSWAQTYPDLQAITRTAQSALAPLAQARALCKSLPPKALLVFSRHADSHPWAYLQSVERLRPDVQTMAWSSLWPAKPYTGRSGLELLGATPESCASRRLNFADYWNQELARRLAAGQDAFLITPPFPADALHGEFLQRFALTRVQVLDPAPLPGPQSLQIFKLENQRPGEPADNGALLGAFDRRLRVFAPAGAPAGLTRTAGAWLPVRLLWETLPAFTPHAYTLTFRLVTVQSQLEKGAKSETLLWTLGQRGWLQNRPAGTRLPERLSETYQFFLPCELHAGRYRLHLALFDATAKEWIPAVKTQDPLGYGALVEEFSVVGATGACP